jgi:hypothetical protein
LPNFLSAPFSPFLRISACGSRCGAKLSHAVTHRLNWQKSKEKVLFSRENRTFWSCWADSNRRPHPYQVIKCHPAVAVQGFAGVFAPKRMRSGTLCSVCSVRSFPRVGHGVGQHRNQQRCGSTFAGRGMVTFCAAGNNKRVSKRRHRATERSVMLPPGGSAGFRYGSKCGSKRFQRIKKRRQNIVDDRTYDGPVGILVMMH